MKLAVLYENDDWLDGFFAALDRRSIPFEPVRMDDAAVLLDDPPAYPLVFNRTSPSSYLRGHGAAIGFARSLLEVLGGGRRVINGPHAFALETSKVAQLILFRRLGVATPRTILFNSTHRVLEAARDMAFPAFLKPDCGGSGAFIKRVASYDALRELLAADGDLFSPDHVMLLQEQVVPDGGTIVRTEFVDGELLYAMRVTAVNTYNLCPAESCERVAADPDAGTPRVEFEPWPDIPPDAVAQAREIVRAADLDVGGVEYVQFPDGTRWFFDLNATSVYRRDVCEALGIDAESKLVDFLDREFRKELAKTGVSANGSNHGGRGDHRRGHHGPQLRPRARV